MRKIIALAAIALALVPMGSFAAIKHKVKATPTVYICQKCHMRFTAAQAKKDHYKDPMDGGKLVPMKAAAVVKKPAPMKGMNM